MLFIVYLIITIKRMLLDTITQLTTHRPGSYTKRHSLYLYRTINAISSCVLYLDKP